MKTSRKATRTSSCAIALLSAMLVLQAKPGFAGPGSVLGGTDPLRSAPPPATRDLAVGDMTVASQTGAFEYSYPIVVPPGRLGSQPSLALSYSSQGALRGTLAAGWQLAIPEVKLTFPNGRRRDQPLEGGVYVSSMSGGHRLVEVNEPVSTDIAGLDTAFRAEYDDSYIRYSIDETGDANAKVVALTTDGMIHRFGEYGYMGLPSSVGVDETRWPLTSTIDKFGNIVEYVYSAQLPDSGAYAEAEEFVLAEIKY